MHEAKFVAYLRVSTARQGQSGLGLEAQREAVAGYLRAGARTPCGEFIEVESGKGSNALDRRPQLRLALDACRRYKATLVIAKLDRLSRDAHFLTGLHNAGVKFVAVDMPEANEMVVTIMAAVAQAERRMISERTKAALAAAKARGVKLGTPRRDTFPPRPATEGHERAGPRPRQRQSGSPRTFAPSWTSLPGYRLTPLPPSWRGAVIRRHAAASGRRAR